jgi:uncharacterized protein (TIGR03067 family)
MIYPVAVIALILALFPSALQGDGGKKGTRVVSEEAKRELKQMAGTWELVFTGRNANSKTKSSKRDVGKLRIVILPDGTVTLPKGDEKQGKILSSWRIDPTARPKTIDEFRVSGALCREGIYELDGDELHFCYAATEGLSRPTDFTFDRGSFRRREIWRRVKNDK